MAGDSYRHFIVSNKRSFNTYWDKLVTKQFLPSLRGTGKIYNGLFISHCDEAISHKDDAFILGLQSSQREIASVVPPSHDG